MSSLFLRLSKTFLCAALLPYNPPPLPCERIPVLGRRRSRGLLDSKSDSYHSLHQHPHFVIYYQGPAFFPEERIAAHAEYRLIASSVHSYPFPFVSITYSSFFPLVSFYVSFCFSINYVQHEQLAKGLKDCL